MGKSLSNLFCGFWTRVAQKTVFHVCALLARLSLLLRVCVWVFFLYFVCVIKFSFIRCTFWSLPSWCHWLWLAEAWSKCFLGVQVNCLQMGMEKFGWNLSLGLVTKWGQICYCNWELSTENIDKKVLILISLLWPSSKLLLDFCSVYFYDLFSMTLKAHIKAEPQVFGVWQSG